ncbi:MAG: PAS domain S-box protein [Desulfotignum sp.]|nr:PAS domain S-box protein [Desulfotignum sp.]
MIPVTGYALASDNKVPSFGAVHLTDEESSWLKAHPEKITLFFNTEFPPIEFISGSGSFTGMGADVISRIESLLGIDFVKTPLDDWNRHLAALKSGECAIAPTIVRTGERETYAFFTKPYATVPVVIITPRTPLGKITLDDLAGRRVGVVSGYATETYLRNKTLQDRFELVTVANVSEGLRRTAFGQIDAFVENLAVAAYYIELEGIPNLRVAGTTDYQFAWSIGVSREYPQLFSAINKAMEQIPADEITAIRKKWIAMEVDFKMDPTTRRNLILTALFSVLLLAGLTGITIFLKRRLNQNIAGLKESEEKYRRLFDHAVEGVFQTTPDGRFLSANPSLARILGYNSARELIEHLQDIGKQHYLNPEDRQTFQRIMETDGETSDFEVQLRKRDGSPIWASIKARAVRDETGGLHHFDGLLEDITERKHVEKALQESEKRYRTILDEMSEGYHEVDLAGNFTFFNEAFLNLFGYSRDEMLGTNFSSYAAEEAIAKRIYRIYNETFRTGAPIQNCEWDILRKDGERRTLEFYASLVRDSKEIATGFRGIVRDITQNKQAEAEREKLQAQLNQAQKMESVGRLAGGVAHDFNNMLGVILGHTDLALLQAGEKHKLYSDLKEIQKAAKRSADITNQLLAFARKQTISPRQLDLNDTVESMLNMFRRLIGENIDLAWNPAPHLWPVKMDPSQIDQILANLCVNARDAIAGVGKLTIETGRKSFDEEYCSEHPGFIPGDFVLLAVSDNGCGMDKDILDNLFEPFFTTKEVGKGTGLGLATIYGICKQNNGFINVYSEPGQGSTFKIYLPRLLADEDTDMTVPEKKAAVKGTETILLVEDEPMILDMTTTMLEMLGYTVLAAASPDEAIRLAKDYTGKIHLLMSDVVLPEMNGRDLAGQIVHLYPGIRLLFMSGYTANVIAHHGVLDDGVAFIQKPFSMADMTEKVREVLDIVST